MDVYNFLKSFLGLPNAVPPTDFNSRRYEENPSGIQEHFLKSDENDEEQLGYNVFSNPLEMHRYFEQQMNEMLKNFGIFGGDSSSSTILGDFFGNTSKHPQIDMGPRTSDTLRDHFLKPGFENESIDKPKTDSDIDGKVDLDDLDSMFSKKRKSLILPIHPQNPSTSHFFGQSVSMRTIIKADGTVETHRTVTDSQGNRETTITHKNGEKEYKVVTRTDPSGKQETEELIVNMDEANINQLIQPSPPEMPHEFTLARWFEKFF